MESSTALYVTRRQRSQRARRHSVVPVVGFAILAIAGALAPPVLLAAETPVETQRNGIVVFIVVVLLFGSAAAGLFFASPLGRRRLFRTPVSGGGMSEPVLGAEAGQPSPRTTPASHAWPAPGRAAPDEWARPSPGTAQPTYVLDGQSFDTLPVAYESDVWYRQPPTAQLTRRLTQAAPAGAKPVASVPTTFAPPRLQPEPTLLTSPKLTQPALVRPEVAPWSTGAPQPDANWDPAARNRRPS